MATAGVVAALALLAVVTSSDGPSSPTTPTGQVLPLPPAGEVLAAHTDDRPVFVVHEVDGTVRVLDAISPHDTGGPAPKVLAYCTRSGRFEDLWHGSRFGRNGGYAGGPAPTGLAQHEIITIREDSVLVGAMGAAPTREQVRPEEPMGDSCSPAGEQDASLYVLHEPERRGFLYPDAPDDDA